MAAKFFTGLPLDGPDPECVLGHGERLLAARGANTPPKPSLDHFKLRPRRRQAPPPDPVALPVIPAHPPDRACDESPLAAIADRRG